MIKSISFLARKPGLSAEDFQRHWREVHAPMWRDVPGVRGYVLNIPIESHGRSDVAALPMGDFDGIAQVWFDDLQARAAAGASAEGKRWHGDGATIIGSIRTFVTEEQVVVPLPEGPRPGVKALTAIRRRPDHTPEQFQQAWRVGHARMAPGVPNLRAFILSGIVEEQFRADLPPLEMKTPLDGFAESWCDDMDARRALVASPEAQEWFADGATFLGEVKTVLLREEVMCPPPR
ncbi:EthD family reductase [Muricoccus radiodurans]|uniref:EthD domain-containing protein n=1 Tax=Muricoccus radiodurans TaxID=2231721 RepID=UPI003CF33E6C